MHLTNKEISYLPFRSYRKVASFRLRARRLTQEDVEQRGGVIHTMESPVAFQPGDYLGNVSFAKGAVSCCAELSLKYSFATPTLSEGYITPDLSTIRARLDLNEEKRNDNADR